MYDLLNFAFVQYLPFDGDLSEGCVGVEDSGISACDTFVSRAVPITPLPTY